MNAKRWMIAALSIAAIASFLNWKPQTPLSAEGRSSERLSSANRSKAARGALLVDGEANPSDVPDIVAYRVFFRVVRDLHAQGHNAALNAYLRRGGVGVPRCATCTTSTVGTDDDLAAIVRISKEFASADSAIEQEHKRQTAQPKTGGAAQMTSVRDSKDRLVEATMASFRNSVSPEVSRAIDTYIQGHIKIRIKIVGGSSK